MKSRYFVSGLFFLLAAYHTTLLAAGKGGWINVNTPYSSSTSRDSWLIGTAWGGPGFNGRYKTWYFLRRGRLRYTTPEGTYTNGRWKLTGNSIYVQKNNRYSEYHGTINGNEMSGRATNIKGQTWVWSRKRLR